MKNTMKAEKTKPLKIVLNIIFWIAIAFFGGAALLSAIAKKTDRQLVDYSVLWVMTESMEPNIGAKSYILVRRADVNSLKEGDVITFTSRDPSIAGSLNTHRISEVVEQGKEFITKGDNNSAPDSAHVYAEDVKYVYVCNLPVMTFFGRVLTTEAGFMCFVSIVLIAVTASSFVAVSKERRKKNEESRQETIDRLVKEEVEWLENQHDKEEN